MWRWMSTVLTTGITAGSLAAVPAHATGNEISWPDMRVANMAHTGGEREAPTNTTYAFARAAELGADMLELDVQSTADDDLVVLHNATVDDTTDGSGRVRDMTTSQVRRLDAAYHFVPGEGTVPGEPDESYPLRGVRTGDRQPPPGYRAEDFAIPTLAEVFERFDDIPINIEIKGNSDLDVKSFVHNAELLADFVNKSGRTDVIVTSFNDVAVSAFHRLAPRVGLAPGAAGLASYFLSGVKPIEGTVALQIPIRLNGLPIATPEFIRRAHTDGYAVHVWFSGTAPEGEATYDKLLRACADGLMTARPSLFEDLLDARGIERPGRPGIDPCG